MKPPETAFPFQSATWRRSLATLFLAFACVLGFATSQAQTAPTLASVNPEDGATLVPTTVTVTYVFDQEMDTSVPLFQSIPNAIAGNFEVTAPNFNQFLIAQWGADKKSFTLKAAIQFPLATFTWRLNPPGGLFPLKSKAGVPLATVSGTFSTGVGGTPPILGSFSPPNNAINIKPDALVSFNFDQVMKTNTAIAGNPPAVPAAIAWSGEGIDPAKFRYNWSLNSRGLLCTYVGGFPPNTVVSWALNPPNAPVKLENLAGKVLASGTYAGSFTTGSGIDCTPPPPPADQGYYTVYKTGSFIQNSAAEPSPTSPDDSYRFGILVQGPSIGAGPTKASLTFPNGTSKDLASVAGLFYQDLQQFPTEAALEQAAPAGNYTVRFTLGVQPESQVTMPMPANGPPTPRILNFDAAQSIASDAPFTLTWNPFPGAGPNDFIAISIFDERGQMRFSAPDPCIPRELPATATSIVIPAKTFVTNSILTGSIIFSRGFFFSTNAVPKMAGSGSFTRNTQFSLRTQATGGGGTGGTPGAAARLSNPTLLPDNRLQFTLNGTPNARYTVQRSARIGADAAWTSLNFLTLDATGRALFEDTQPTPPPAFYRAVSP